MLREDIMVSNSDINEIRASMTIIDAYIKANSANKKSYAYSVTIDAINIVKKILKQIKHRGK